MDFYVLLCTAMLQLRPIYMKIDSSTCKGLVMAKLNIYFWATLGKTGCRIEWIDIIISLYFNHVFKCNTKKAKIYPISRNQTCQKLGNYQSIVLKLAG